MYRSTGEVVYAMHSTNSATKTSSTTEHGKANNNWAILSTRLYNSSISIILWIAGMEAGTAPSN